LIWKTPCLPIIPASSGFRRRHVFIPQAIEAAMGFLRVCLAVTTVVLALAAALFASGLGKMTVVHRPRLLSDNGASCNYAAHKQPNVLKWLADHPRWTFHFTPTSASWLNAVEGFFSPSHSAEAVGLMRAQDGRGRR